MKGQPMEWEKIFVDHIFNKSHFTKYIKNSYNSPGGKKTKYSNLKMGKEPEQMFL